MKCSQCRHSKPDDQFIGLHNRPITVCASCSASALAYRNAHKESSLQYAKAYREAHQEKVDAYGLVYRAEHRDKAKERTRVWRAAHPGYNDQQVREWRAAHPKRARASKRKWADANPEKMKASSRRWARVHPERAKAKGRNRRARIMGSEGKHSAADITWLYEQQGGRCEACRKKFSPKGKGTFHVDHMLPLVLGGSNDRSNLQLLCPTCNKRKGSIPYEEWCSKLGRFPFLVSKAS